MNWSYRVVKQKYLLPQSMRIPGKNKYAYTWTIYEIYYDKDDKVGSWSEEPIEPRGDNKKELKRDLELMLKALDEPVLEMDEKGNLR